MQGIHAIRLAAMASGFLLGTALPALASNFGSIQSGSDTGWLTDNGTVIVTQINLESATTTGVNNAVANYNTVFSSTFGVSTWADTACTDVPADMCVYDSYYGATLPWNAVVSCIGTTSGSHPNKVCTVTEILINLSKNLGAQRLACHEMGHSVGLRHSSESASCMKDTSAGGTSAVLSSHDKNHLATFY